MSNRDLEHLDYIEPATDAAAEPLGKPRGSVRAMIALYVVGLGMLTLTAAVAALLWMHEEGDDLIPIAVAVLASETSIVTGVLGWYFGSRPS